MNDPRVRAIARDMSQTILDHWVTYKEPYSVAVIGNNYVARLKRALGFDCTIGWFLETLAKSGLFVMLRAKNSKRWVFLGDIWRGLSDSERAYWLDWIQTAIDPRAEATRIRASLNSSTPSKDPKDSTHKP